jgi:HK97 family phage prohead protease
MDETSNMVEGYAIVFDQPSADLGGFTEMIDPHACDESLNKSDIVMLYNHNWDQPLGRTSAPNSLELWTDQQGLGFRCMLPDTQVGRDARELISKNILQGCSFGFRTKPSDVEWSKMGEKRLCRVKNMDLLECSLCVLPAYDGSSVQNRALNLNANEFKSACDAVEKQELEEIRSEIIKNSKKFYRYIE